jgi:hypothetical protein
MASDVILAKGGPMFTSDRISTLNAAPIKLRWRLHRSPSAVTSLSSPQWGGGA